MLNSMNAQVVETQASQIRDLHLLGLGQEDVLTFWFGEGDWHTPDVIKQACIDSLLQGNTFYTQNSGLPELRLSICNYLNQLHGSSLLLENITVTASGMQSIMLTFQALVSKGDRVVVVEPCWPNVTSASEILGAQVTPFPLQHTDTGWQLDINKLDDFLKDNTKALFINSPSNPTGWAMTSDEWMAVVNLCRKKDIWLVADEVYSRMTFNGECSPSVLSHCLDSDKVIVVNSFSKAWAMTGWRLGWIVAPKLLQNQLAKLSEFNIAAPPAFIQHAGIAALEKGEQHITKLNQHLHKNRNLAFNALKSFKRIESIQKPNAAFYLFFKVSGVVDSFEFAKELLQETGVGIAPGSAFGESGNGFMRLCFASSEDKLQQAMKRLAKVLDK